MRDFYKHFPSGNLHTQTYYEDLIYCLECNRDVDVKQQVSNHISSNG